MKITRKVIFIGGAIILIIVVVVLLAVFLNQGDNNGSTDSAEVTTKYGKVSGEWKDGAQGRGFKYASFRGIPYAQPPIGELRFKGPRPPLPWNGVLSAKEEPNQCTQTNGGGHEDCLYLNVYTPKLPTAENNPKMAVLVYIHGGGFKFGNSSRNTFGPDFLTAQDVVIVTMNYRLGILANFGLDTEDIPGNAALKDQLQALRWVKENIAVFGGDPSKLTLGGQSSGGVSTCWLSILPQTKELIRSAIIISGNAVSSWSHTDHNVEFAKATYKILTGKSTDDLSEITQAFKKAHHMQLHFAAEAAVIPTSEAKWIGSDIEMFYSPIIERRPQGEEEILVTKDPESYIIDKDLHDIPILIGETKKEWTLFFETYDYFNNEPLLDEAVKNLKTLVPSAIFPGADTRKYLGIDDSSYPPRDKDTVVQQIQDYYFYKNEEADCNTNCKMAHYLNHAFIMADMAHFLRLRSRYSSQPTYAYVFSLRSDYSTITEDLPSYLMNDVVHGFDLYYLWWDSTRKQKYYGDNIASKCVRRVVTMVANFIKESNPTPQTDVDVDVLWKPVRQGDAETYLDINEELTQQVESLAGKDSGPFWDSLYSDFRLGKSP